MGRVFGAFIRRDWTIARSYRLPFYMVVGSSAFLLVLLYEVGHLFDLNPTTTGRDNPLSHGYFGFALVGIAVLQIVYSAVQSFALQIREEQTTGTLEILLATPTSPSVVILGSALYDLIQPTVVSVLMVAVGALAGNVGLAAKTSSALAAAAALIGLLALFAGLGILVAAFTVVFKQGTSVVTLLVTALGLFGGAYFPVTQFPEPLRWIAEALPFTWGVDVLRQALLLGQVEVGRLVGLLIGGAALLPVSLYAFHVAVQRARVRGTLAQY